MTSAPERPALGTGWRAAAWVLLALLTAALPLNAQEPVLEPRPAHEPVRAQDPIRASLPPSEPLRLTLAESLELALRNNLALQAAAISPEIETQRILVQQGAFDPLFDFNGSRQDAETPTGSQIEAGKEIRYGFDSGIRERFWTGTSFEVRYLQNRLTTNQFFATLNPVYTNLVSFTLAQPVLRGGWAPYNLNLIRQARLVRKASVLTYDSSVRDTLLLVEQLYWDLVFAIQDLEVKRGSVKLGEELRDINRRRLEVGVGTQLEITEAESNIATRQAAVTVAENVMNNLKDRLRRLILPDDAPELWRRDLIPSETAAEQAPPVPEFPEAYKTALANRPEYRRSEVSLKALELEVDRLKNLRLPQLDLVSSWQLNALSDSRGDNASQLWNHFRSGGDEFRTWEAGLSFSIPIGNRSAHGLWLAQVLTVRQARVLQRDLALQIGLEVAEALRLISDSAKAIEESRRARELTEEQLRAEQARYESGLSTNYQVLEVQDDLAQRRSAEKRAVSSLAIAVARFERAVGRVPDLTRPRS